MSRLIDPVHSLAKVLWLAVLQLQRLGFIQVLDLEGTRQSVADMLNINPDDLDDGMGPDDEGAEVPALYDGEGWSIATSNGCRTHKLVDEYLATLSKGGAIEKDVAATTRYRHVCFDPMTLAGYTNARTWYNNVDPAYVHPLEADNDHERSVARRAAFLGRIRAFWNRQSVDSFAMDDDIDGDGNRDHRIEPGHCVVFAAGNETGTPADQLISEWPARARALIQAELDARLGGGDDPEFG